MALLFQACIEVNTGKTVLLNFKNWIWILFGNVLISIASFQAHTYGIVILDLENESSEAIEVIPFDVDLRGH